MSQVGLTGSDVYNISGIASKIDFKDEKGPVQPFESDGAVKLHNLRPSRSSSLTSHEIVRPPSSFMRGPAVGATVSRTDLGG